MKNKHLNTDEVLKILRAVDAVKSVLNDCTFLQFEMRLPPNHNLAFTLGNTIELSVAFYDDKNVLLDIFFQQFDNLEAFKDYYLGDVHIAPYADE